MPRRHFTHLSSSNSCHNCLPQDLPPTDAGPSYVNCDLPEPRLSFPPPALLGRGGGGGSNGLPALLPPLGRAPTLPPLTLYLPPANSRVTSQPPPDPDTGSPSHQVMDIECETNTVIRILMFYIIQSADEN